jgi:4-diphosphocytidyl-2-C-methyl-D-erythritol kinase
MAQPIPGSTVRVRTCSKINLSLDITGRRSDGYHEILSIMQSLELGDELLISDQGRAGSAATAPADPVLVSPGVDLSVTGYNAPADRSNLAWRAADLVLRTYAIERSVRIQLTKRIPVAAGLAGGSSDAAGVIVGLNTLLELGLEQDEMEALGSKLGADVPFCIRCGTARAEGIGERLTQLPSLSRLIIVLIVPNIAVSAAEMYRLYDSWPASDLVRPDTHALERAIRDDDVAGIGAALENVFYPIVSSLHPIVGEIVRFARSEGAVGAMMSGSGPSVFAVVTSETEAHRIASLAADTFRQSYVAITRASSGLVVERE